MSQGEHGKKVAIAFREWQSHDSQWRVDWVLPACHGWMYQNNVTSVNRCLHSDAGGPRRNGWLGRRSVGRDVKNAGIRIIAGIVRKVVNHNL